MAGGVFYNRGANGGLPGMAFPEVYYRRMDYSTESTQTMGTTGTDCRLSFRLMPIEYAIRVSGLILSATSTNPVSTGTLMRLYLQAADTASPYKPSGATIFDTGSAGFSFGDTTAALYGSADRFVEKTLTTPVDITTPGLYWLGVFTQTPAAATGTFRCANLRGYYKGLGDLSYTFGGADLAAITNANFATFTPPTSITTSVLTRAADTDPCCISIGLVCQRI